MRMSVRPTTCGLAIALLLAACSAAPGGQTAAPSAASSPTRPVALSPTPLPTALSPTVEASPSVQALPPISYFREHPSDQFLVRMTDFVRGTPFLGVRASQPHQGAHVHFENRDDRWPVAGSAVEGYPPVYAVADGVVDRVEDNVQVGANARYGIALRIAREGGTSWNLDYLIEPMSPEPSPGFYRQFILVRQGEFVRKGQVIAYVYTPPKSGDGIHIHFHLMATSPGAQGAFQAPAIFDGQVVQQFYERWHAATMEGGKLRPCMGWMLGAAENPFGTGAVDCLNATP